MTDEEKMIMDMFKKEYLYGGTSEQKLTEDDRFEALKLALCLQENEIQMDKDPVYTEKGCNIYFSIPEFYIDEKNEKQSYKEVIVPKVKDIFIDLMLLKINDDMKEDVKEYLEEVTKFFCKVRKDVVFTRERQEYLKKEIEEMIEKYKKKMDEYEEV